MSKQNKFIPNPNKISNIEQDFIQGKKTNDSNTDLNSPKISYKGRMISMPDTFYNQLSSYLRTNPTEGTKSSFIVRVVAEYIQNKQ